MSKKTQKLLAVIPRLPLSFENQRDSRLLNVMKYFAKQYEVHLLYIQSFKEDQRARKRIEKYGINVFSVRDKSKAAASGDYLKNSARDGIAIPPRTDQRFQSGNYDLETQMKRMLECESYNIVYFNTHYTAKYYLPFIETYLPEALIVIDAVHSQYVSAIKSADKMLSGIQKTIALKQAENIKMLEIPVLSHADVIYTDGNTSAKILTSSIPNVQIKITGKGDNVQYDKYTLKGSFKKEHKPEIEKNIDIVIFGKNENMNKHYEKGIAEIVAKYTNAGIRKVEGESFIECFNKTAKQLKGDYAFIVGDNSIVNGKTLPALIYASQVDPSYGVLEPGYNHNIGYSQGLSSLEEFAIKHYRANFGNWIESKCISDECFLIKNELFDKVGMLDTRFNTAHYALFDYSLRILQAGYQIIKINESFVYILSKIQENLSDVKHDRSLLFLKWGNISTEFLGKLRRHYE